MPAHPALVAPVVSEHLGNALLISAIVYSPLLNSLGAGVSEKRFE
jgi:hypothetical protein